MTILAFAAILCTLFAAHHLADHVLGQTDTQAAAKAGPGWTGWAADLRHVVQYHLVIAVMVGITVAVLDVPLTATGATAGLSVSAGTHLFWDRRWPVRWVLEHAGARQFARLGSPDRVQVGMNGMYLADQSLHLASLWLAALLAATL